VDSDQKIAAAKRDLERMSSRLHDTLRESEAKEADVAQQIEAISAKEAAIRKARILTWLKVRHMLHPDQRKAVEEAIQSGH
jgi:type VI protein secretion system component VasF